PVVCLNLQQRDHHLPTILLQLRPLPRHAEQRARVHEAPRRPEVAQREGHGLYRLNMGHNQGNRRSK
ncbi:potassium voltage-gated channel protein eag, partial [Biomphalaria pfeifferi]